MSQITEFLTNLGNTGLDLFSVPLLIWTVISLAGLAVLKLSDNIHPAYQYHGRIAILCSLPLGILASFIGSWNIFSSAESSETFSKFLIIQNPISITTGTKEQALHISDPGFIAGAIISLAVIIMTGYFAKVALHIWSLNRFSSDLTFENLEDMESVSPGNKKLLDTITKVEVAFTEQADVPFTFGFFRKTVVLPAYIRHQPEKMNMALRHELIHIKHGDYLLNILLMTIKGTFWLHPLVHKFYKDFKDYRELLCDSQVLTDTSIPQKGYAELLVELAPKKVFRNYPTVSMSINSSTLKKRIQTMKTQNSKNISAFSSSLTLMFLSLFLITGIMACTDIQENGITNTEIQQTQQQIESSSEDNQPLYVVDGEIDPDLNKDIMSRINPDFIKSIEVLKGEKATQKYGDKGKDGVINIIFHDKEAALNNLNESAPTDADISESMKEDFFRVVEEMPQLVDRTQLAECVEYPERAKRAGIEGRVTISFIVNEQGNVENPEVIRGVESLNEEAMRCVKQLTFTPGQQKGKTVRVQYAMPVNFTLGSQDSTQN